MMKKWLLGLCALLSSLTLHAETVNLTYRGLDVSANLETSGTDWQKKPVLLMTHGTLAHNKMEIMATLQQAFLERGISSLAINLSLGLSDREGMYNCATPHTHKHTDAVEEIGLWLGWLEQQGAENIVLLGHSRGGNQTARYAATHDSDAIKGIVLIAPQTWHKGYEAKDYMRRYGKVLPPLLEKAEKLVATGKSDTMLAPVDFIYCENTSATADAFVSYYQDDPLMDTPAVLSDISKPALVFAGSADTVVKDLAEKMNSAAERENVSFEVIDGADHFFRDLYAEELADMAQEFIESL